MKETIYLAGPMRGYEKYNFPLFLKVADYLRKSGYEVVCPAEHDLSLGFDVDKPMDQQHPDFPDITELFVWDLQQVMASDGIALLPGWKESTGAATEAACAWCTGRKLYEVVVEVNFGPWSCRLVPMKGRPRLRVEVVDA